MVEYKEYEDDIFYIIGEEKGMEKGIKEGIEKGKELNTIIAIRNMLGKKLDIHLIAEILEVETSFVQKVKRQLQKEAQIAEALKSAATIETVAKKLRVLPTLVEVVKSEHKL